jgi:threonine aldolase
LHAAGYEILNEVTLNQVLVSFGDDATTRAVIGAVQADGTCWCGGTLWHGRAAMRISVSSWATTTEDVEQCLAAMIRLARRAVA